MIIGAIAALVGIPLLEGAEIWGQIGSRKDMSQQGRLVMDRMSRELMAARRLANNTPNIAEVTATPCIRFTDVRGQLTLYTLNGTRLDRATGGTCGVPSSVNPLGDNVSGFSITCYDNANSVLAPCTGSESSIRRVSLDLSLTQSNETLDFKSNVTLRNLAGL